jgi:uncharacterized protein (TIGR03067 family)
MKWFLCLSLIVAFSGLAFGQEKKEAGDDQKIQGKWEMVEGEQNGQKFDDEFVKGFKLSFDKDKYDAKLANGDGEDGTFKIDAKDTPHKSLKFTTAGSEVRQAIYDWDGETLKLCVSDRGGDKPKEFAGKDGNISMVLRKAK